MNSSEKIILTTVLTWAIFGLFNLFGQPQFFLPPLPYNGYILALAAAIIYLQHKPHEFQKSGYYLFTVYVLICICASFYEAFEINALFFLLLIFFTFELVVFPIVLFKYKSLRLYFVTHLIVYLFIIITFILLLIPFSESDAGVYLYFLTGLMAFAGNLFFRKKGSIYIHNTLWLYVLGVFFDAGEYLIVNYTM